MKFLLDTHVFLWWIKGDVKLTKDWRDKILKAQEVYVSSASIWECIIKINLGKLDANASQLLNSVVDSGFIELPILCRHAIAVSNLPDIHRDPFDRILIAQAISEPLIFLTTDSLLQQFSELVELIL